MIRGMKSLLAGAIAICWSVFPPAGEARAAGAVVEHRIRAGDNLHLIAGFYYKDPRKWKRIHRFNGKALREPNLLRPGRVIRVEIDPGKGWDIPYEEFVSRVRRK